MLQSLLSLFRRSGTPQSETPPARTERPAAAVGSEDQDLSWVNPPGDIHDVAAWDHYWYEQATHGLSPALFDMFSRIQNLVDEMLKRGFSTVLCAGSGISQEPRALAYAGMTVKALDTSPVAMELARTFPADDQYLQRFFDRPQRRPGGTVEYVVGDFRDPSVCPGSFQVVIERRTIQLFPEGERSAALEALAERLAHDGILLSHFHSASWKPGEPRKHPAESWFVRHRFAICDVTGRRLQEWPGIGDTRSAWLLTTTG